MKRFLSVLFILLLMVSATACDSPEPTAPPTQPTAAPTEAPTLPPETEAPVSASLPLSKENMEFYFLSGAGAWRTVLTLHADGTFSGFFLDSDMGDMGDDYPSGTAYICNFSGRFDRFAQMDDHSWSMTLAEIQTERTAGEEWIADTVRYVASEPYGLTGGTEFVLYLPDTPAAGLSEGFLSWWPYRFEALDTLSCFGIHNVATGDGFFTVG